MFKEAFRGLKHRASVMTMAFAVMLVSATSVFAADPVVDTTQVTTTFSSMTTTVITVIGTVAGSAVLVMGVILGWKYGRKLFGMLAK